MAEKRLTVKVKNIKNYGSGDEVTFQSRLRIDALIAGI